MRRLLIALLLLLPVGLLPVGASAEHPLGLKGTLTGAVTTQPPVPDAPPEHQLVGKGVTNLGATHVHGTVRGTGFVQGGRCSGSLTLSSPRGSASVRISSSSLPGFTECPHLLSWQLTGKSGQLAGIQGSGTMHLVVQGGMFRLTFDGPGSSFPALPSTGGSALLTWSAVVLLMGASYLGRHRRS